MGNIIESGEQIIEDQQCTHPNGIDIAGSVYRWEEDQQAAHAVRNGAPTHKGNAATQLVSAFICQIGNPGIGDGIHHSADTAYDSHDQRRI